MTSSDFAQQRTDESSLILAAEECRPETFDELHKFSDHDRRLIRKLIAHGPVLLQGGRGTGKSALMIAATRQMAPHIPKADVMGLYISLRYVPLLQASGPDYEKQFCKWVSRQIKKALGPVDISFVDAQDLHSLKQQLSTSYPYGLTNQKIERLKYSNIDTVGQLANASDEELLDI